MQPRRLTELRRGSGPHRRRVTLYLDGDLWRTTTASVVRELGLAEGDELDVATTEADARALEAAEVRERALRLLGYRERSVHDLRAKLADDGYPDDLVASLVSDFTAAGLVDDERFGALLARSLVQLRGYGHARARRELARHGLSDDLVDRVLLEAAPAEDEEARATDAARRLHRPADTVDRLAARLLRRGFAPSVAFAVARTCVHDDPADSLDSI